MPASAITVSVTFKKTQAQLDKEAIDAVKAAIEGGTYRVAQATANDAASVRTWLATTLNVLFGQSQGVLFRSNQPSIIGDVAVTAITPAVAGSEAQPSGTNGSFAYTVSLTKGRLSFSATVATGVIVATPHASRPVKRIELLSLGGLTLRIINTGNIATGDLTIALSGSNADAFSVETLNLASLPVGGEADVRLTPRINLTVGAYTVTLTITISGDGMTETLVMTYTVVPTGIASQPSPTKVWTQGSTLYISTSTFGEAYIYNVAGQQVKMLHARSPHGETVTTQLPRGIYIVVVGGKTYKVIVS
jgi:hypothetical protein